MEFIPSLLYNLVLSTKNPSQKQRNLNIEFSYKSQWLNSKYYYILIKTIYIGVKI